MILDKVSKNIHTIQTRIESVLDQYNKNNNKNNNVEIVAVTKNASYEETQAILECGIYQLGESKVQVAEEKINHFGREFAQHHINWHLIGHLQTNKVKKAVQLFDCIQSVDSMRVLEKIDKECGALNKQVDVFLQVNIANEPNKFGFSEVDLLEQMEQIKNFRNVVIKGIMVMGPNVEDVNVIESCFRHSAQLFEKIQKDVQTCRHLSMGMSQDFELAIACGSTMCRLGTSLYK